jgi:peptide/nickel transport system substrate-binding protein/oligopeptide transport system substrate-binding protein
MSRKILVLPLLAMLVAALVLPGAVPVSLAQAANVDVYGRALPADAAPYHQQVWTELCDSTRKETTLMSAISVYQRICSLNGFDQLGDPLVDLDQNLNLIPAAADKWEASTDGLSWTFHLHPGQVWSDGTPVTANDYVATYQNMVDPKSAYDFVWVWQGIIKNWSEAVAGEAKITDIGMKAVDDLTIQVTTVSPTPYLPLTLFFWAPLQAKALKQSGPNYMLDPKTSVSSGPFILKEFVAGDHLLLQANPTYTGYRKPWLYQIRGTYGDMNNGSFTAFQAHTIERVNYQNLTSADFKVINADKTLSANYHPNFGDFRNDYLFFDSYNAPFNDVNVRLAFAKAVDRASIVKDVIGSQLAIPAPSFLAPGFPAADVTGKLKDIQAYDCPAAQALLAKAGFPDGKGFPDQELELRGESKAVEPRFDAAAASISKCLNIKVSVNNMQYADFMKGLLARPTTIKFGAVSYGMDYLDPSNMLGLWVSTGRQSWRNADYDKLIAQANAMVGDPAKRTQIYQDAEKILVSDVGGIFLDWRIQGDLFQPYVMGGDCFKQDAQGVSAWHWGNLHCWGQLYIGANVKDSTTYHSALQ